MGSPTKEQLLDWQKRLSKLNDEMEGVSEPLVCCNPPDYEMAVSLAFGAVVREVQSLERKAVG